MKTLRIPFAVALLISLPTFCFAENENPLADWLYLKSTAKEHSVSPITVTSGDKTKIESFISAYGQYVTEDPFHTVVRFYVEKSGQTPPNWSILGRQFPGTKVNIPAHFSHVDIYRKQPSVTILHYIRENTASAQFLMTDLPEAGFMSVSITRGKDDTKTLIQITRHPAKAIEKG